MILDRIADFHKSLKVNVVELRGISKWTGDPVSIACAVGEKTAFYLADSFLETGYQIENLGSTWLWDLSDYALREAPQAILLFAEIGSENKKLAFYGNRYFRIPLLVGGCIHLPLDQKIKQKKSYKEELRRIRKAGFTYEISRSRSQFDDFFDNMYIPQIRKSHGRSAVILDKGTYLKLFNKLELLLVKGGDAVIAGELISYEGGMPRLTAVGIRNSDSELLRQGALAACYLFALQYLGQQGYSTIDLGDSRGFVNDGVLSYKRKWGHVLIKRIPLLLLMKVLSNGRAVRRLLRNMPIICMNDGELTSMVFMDEIELNDVRASTKFISQNHVPGTKNLVAYLFNDRMTFSKSDLVTLA